MIPIFKNGEHNPMGSHKNRICLYSPLDVEDYVSRHIKADCAFHEHMSRDKADRLTGHILYTSHTNYGIFFHTVIHYEFNWVPPVLPDTRSFAIVQVDNRVWTI